MNERIRELKQQARDFYLLQEDLDCSIKELHELVDTKFAELIIRKCAKVADLADEHKCEWIGGNILTHFGVEE